MNTRPQSNKYTPGVGLVAKVAVAVTLLAVGAWALRPAAVRTGRSAVAKIVAWTNKSETPGAGDTSEGQGVEPAVTRSLLDPPTYSGDDWPGWRGTGGNNCSPDARCPTVWSETKNIKWRTEIPGKGHSSPVVVGDRLFVTTAVEGSRQVLALAFDKETGEEIWRHHRRRRKLRTDPSIQFACLVDADLRWPQVVRRGTDRQRGLFVGPVG